MLFGGVFFFFLSLVLLTSSACFGLWPWSVAVLLEPLDLIRSRVDALLIFDVDVFTSLLCRGIKITRL